MALELKKREDNGTIQVRDLVQGQIAIIIEWGGYPNYNGRLVQRYKDSLVELGVDSGWADIPSGDNFRVKILEKGTELVIR